METFLINLFSVFILALFSLGPSIIGSMLIWALQGFTVKSEETTKKIIVSWRGEHWYFWMLLLNIAVLLYYLLNVNFSWTVLVVTICLLLFLFFAGHMPRKVVIEFDLENRKIFIRETHLYLKTRLEEIRFEDVESVEQERMYDPNARSFETDLILKAKGYVGSLKIKKAGLSQEKLEQVVGLPR